MSKLFKETVLEINQKDYSNAQVQDWASCGDNDLGWENKFKKFTHFVYENNNQIIGFCAIDKTGFINSMFVSKDHQRQNIGKKLMSKILDFSSAHKIKNLKSEVSITAKPFFESFGFKVVKQQEAKANKLTLTNYVMVKNNVA